MLGKSLDEGIGKNTTTMCFGRITVLAMLGTKISEVSPWQLGSQKVELVRFSAPRKDVC